jgi:hypothetical protein
MKKIDKTIIYVVDFTTKQVLLTETLSSKDTKKDEAAMLRIENEVSLLVAKVQKEVKKAS